MTKSQSRGEGEGGVKVGGVGEQRKRVEEIRTKVDRRDAARKHVLAYDTVETAWTNLVRDSNADIHFLLSELDRKNAALKEIDEETMGWLAADYVGLARRIEAIVIAATNALAEQEEA